jgi:hypothetical protein
MQAPPPAPVKLHWIPVEPSWLVSAGLVLLAALPHQIPAYIRAFLLSSAGALLYVAAAAWTLYKKPVLGIAMFLLIVGLRLTAGSAEGFLAPILNKDPVQPQQRRKWFQEEIMTEEPHVIQERTDNEAITYDEVSSEERDAHWYSDSTLDKHPTAIQERPVHSGIDYDHDGGQ